VRSPGRAQRRPGYTRSFENAAPGGAAGGLDAIGVHHPSSRPLRGADHIFYGLSRGGAASPLTPGYAPVALAARPPSFCIPVWVFARTVPPCNGKAPCRGARCVAHGERSDALGTHAVLRMPPPREGRQEVSTLSASISLPRAPCRCYAGLEEAGRLPAKLSSFWFFRYKKERTPWREKRPEKIVRELPRSCTWHLN
jgi:hypothetical protein